MNVFKKRKRKLTKKESQFIHAKKRAIERYDLVLTRADYEKLVSRVQKGKARFMKKQTNRITIWTDRLYDQEIRFVYDKLRKTIVSFLPLEERWKTIK